MSLKVHEGVRTIQASPSTGTGSLKKTVRVMGGNPHTHFNLSSRPKARDFTRIGWTAPGGPTPPL